MYEISPYTFVGQSGTGGVAEYKPLPSGPSGDSQKDAKEPEVNAVLPICSPFNRVLKSKSV